MKKKLLAVLLSAAMTAGILAGCGNSKTEPKQEAPASDQAAEPEDTAAADQAESEEPETQEENAEVDPASVTGEITYWSFTDYANNLVKEFNEVYPNVTIDLQVFGGDEYKTKILTALQSQDGVPDLFDLEEGYIYEFLDSDLIADLSYMNIDELTKDYYEFQRASMKDSNGNFKSLLFQSSPVAFWYLRDACEEWLGTSDPDEISVMLTDWDTIIAKGEEIYEKSNGEVYLWPGMGEMVKVNAFSYDPLVRDGKLEITDDWMSLIDNMRKMYDSKANAELGAWSSEWAAAWNEGKLLFRVMPSWDFFTDWETNKGNVGVAAPFDASYEGGTGVCVYNNSDKKDLAALFLTYIASDDFQKVNMENYNQIPASKPVCDELAENFAAEDFGGQNLLATYSVICDKIAGITPDKYTRPTQNLFSKVVSNGIKEGQDNDTIIENFKKELKDQYPEVIMD
jgi:multiple sugar transport system substrate-binding protein